MFVRRNLRSSHVRRRSRTDRAGAVLGKLGSPRDVQLQPGHSRLYRTSPADMWRPLVSLRSSIYTVAWSSLLIPLVVLVLALRALALDSEPDPAPSGDMNREPADPEPKNGRSQHC